MKIAYAYLRVALGSHSTHAILPAVLGDSTITLALSIISKTMVAAGNDIINVYTIEIFPTSFRNQGFNSCNFFGGMGALVASFHHEIVSRQKSYWLEK